eukprot:314584_1
MSNNMFKCDQNTASECAATRRIKAILHSSMQFHHINEQEVISDILTQYNDDANTKLLRDFNHIKYYHQIDTIDEKFDQIYNHLTDANTTVCDIKQCKYINVFYRDRSKITNKYFSTNDNNMKLTLELISRIHMYFIHSYHIDRLTVKERNMIEDSLKEYNNAILNDEKEAASELVEDKRIELITMIMQKKTKSVKCFEK